MKNPLDPSAAPGDRLAGDTRLELAEACRRIIDELASSAADSASFTAAARLVQQAADILGHRAHGRPYEPAEASLGSMGEYQEYLFIDHSPMVGPLNPLAPPLVFTSDGTKVTATVTFGAAYEGPPGCVHGGYIAAAFDEVLGFAQGMSGAPGMTGRLTVSYRSPTPLHQQLQFVGDVERIDGRKIFTRGELRVAADGRLCADAEGLFISVRPETFRRLITERAADQDG